MVERPAGAETTGPLRHTVVIDLERKGGGMNYDAILAHMQKVSGGSKQPDEGGGNGNGKDKGDGDVAPTDGTTATPPPSGQTESGA